MYILNWPYGSKMSSLRDTCVARLEQAGLAVQVQNCNAVHLPALEDKEGRTVARSGAEILRFARESSHGLINVADSATPPPARELATSAT